jgi:aryl-alcohol dehydrogenase-like predicted oxidoreductase
MARRRLGRTDLEVSPIGLGCWQLASGGGVVGGFWGQVAQGTARAIVRTALEGGIDWFDTAEIYGGGRSERALADALLAAGTKKGDVVVATKWWPALRTAKSIGETIDERLESLAPFGVDLHQVHQPFALTTVEAQMHAMADLVQAGKIRAVGVSNFSERRMRTAHAALAERGIPLASNQMRFSLVDRSIESDGVLAAAKELGVTIIAYSPLGQGVLSGKFHDDPQLIASRAGPRKMLPAFRARGLQKSRALVEALKAIGQSHGATAAQVALAWVTQVHGDAVVAIPGATSPSQVADHRAAMGLRLTDAEMRKLDELSRPFV